MPDMPARSWFRRVAKLFGEQLSANDIVTHAELIGIENPNRLLTCIQNSGTATARQIIRLLYTKEEMEEKTGMAAVSQERRDAIRSEYYLYDKKIIIVTENNSILQYCFAPF